MLCKSKTCERSTFCPGYNLSSLRSACSQCQFPKSRVGMITSTVGAQHHGATSSVHKDIKMALAHHIKVLPFLALPTKQSKVRAFYPGTHKASCHNACVREKPLTKAPLCLLLPRTTTQGPPFRSQKPKGLLTRTKGTSFCSWSNISTSEQRLKGTTVKFESNNI